ncbi:Leucine-rich_repeat domain superfamily [Hexamita inflata]|uniref:Leucine-rich repeat domain superfamily n=1 Tax=Hexamita inflata TaxID=28002 RepID=A0AA86UC53_9EUKA|nr:Leucine-rich repeat domain superfamily [Hexamita inflata]
MLQNCSIYEISALRPLLSLTYLDLSNNPVTFSNPLIKHQYLEELFLSCIDPQSLQNHANFCNYTLVHQIPTENNLLLADKMRSIDNSITQFRRINARINFLRGKRAKMDHFPVENELRINQFATKVAELFQTGTSSDIQ